MGNIVPKHNSPASISTHISVKIVQTSSNQRTYLLMKRIHRICNLICNKIPILRKCNSPGKNILCCGLKICATLVRLVLELGLAPENTPSPSGAGFTGAI